MLKASSTETILVLNRGFHSKVPVLLCLNY